MPMPMPTPTATTAPSVHMARFQLTAAVLRLLAAEHGDESHAHYADSVDYYADQVGDAARELTQALDAASDEQLTVSTTPATSA